MDITELKEKIVANKIDEAICIVKQIARKKYKEAVPFLIEQLETTDNHLFRNAIATALSDIGSQEAVEPIIRMLKHPKTNGYRGTLLAALEPFDYSAYLDMLVEFLCEGNFEVSRKSLILIESIVEGIPDDIKQKCIIKIKKKTDNLQDRIDFLVESLEVFTSV